MTATLWIPKTNHENTDEWHHCRHELWCWRNNK